MFNKKLKERIKALEKQMAELEQKFKQLDDFIHPATMGGKR